MSDLPTMEVHDLGCRCWPHVSEKDALACIADAAHREYREGLRRVAAAPERAIESESGRDLPELADAPRGLDGSTPALDVERLARALAAWWSDIQAAIKSEGYRAYTMTLDPEDAAREIASAYDAEGEQ